MAYIASIILAIVATIVGSVRLCSSRVEANRRIQHKVIEIQFRRNLHFSNHGQSSHSHKLKTKRVRPSTRDVRFCEKVVPRADETTISGYSQSLTQHCEILFQQPHHCLKQGSHKILTNLCVGMRANSGQSSALGSKSKKSGAPAYARRAFLEKVASRAGETNTFES